MELRRFLGILTAAVVIMLTAVVWFAPSGEDFRADNPSWNGTREISSLPGALPVMSLADLPPSPGGSLADLSPSPKGVTLILIPYLEFTPAELEALDSFVAGGGTLVLADDYGYGNQVLEYLGLEARFSGQALLDPLACYKNKWFPRVSRIIPSPLTDDTGELVLNHATCLTGVETIDALALSSVFSFLDLNGNESSDEGEPTGPLPVISHHDLGSGEVVLITDPSIFINSMDTLGGNATLVQNIAAITTSGLLIDQSHLPPSSLHHAKGLLAGVRGSLATPAGAVGLVITALAITLVPVWYKKGDRNDRRKEGETPGTG